MGVKIGIRRESKNRWERRVPLIPSDVAALQEQHALRFVVQPSAIRTFSDDEYRQAGVSLDERMRGASIVFGVKEVPIRLLRPGKVYVFFSHVAKGQSYNMAMLQKLIDYGCSLIDYERITDESNRRLVFFGRHAGNAGMIDTLRALGLRLACCGIQTPFAEIRPAFEYPSLQAAKTHINEVGSRIASDGLPDSVRPLVFGVTGYGNVSEGVQEVLSWLPVESVPISHLRDVATRRGAGPALLAKVVFREEDMARPREPGASFSLQDYYNQPERYEGRFEEYLDYLDVLVNAIYWETRFPRLVTRQWVQRNYRRDTSPPRLKVIGDISCDIEGSVELTVKPTSPDLPTYVVDPDDGAVRDGVEGNGPVIMAVDNLPCELPRESSEHFSSVLKDMVPEIAAADWQADLDQLVLRPALKRALIIHKGQLTPDYRYLSKYLGGASSAKGVKAPQTGMRAS